MVLFSILKSKNLLHAFPFLVIVVTDVKVMKCKQDIPDNVGIIIFEINNKKTFSTSSKELYSIFLNIFGVCFCF